MILVAAEQRDGKLNRASWEAIAAAQSIAAPSSAQVVVVLAGKGLDEVAAELSAAAVAEVVTIAADALASYTADGYTAALQSAVASLAPAVVVFPHTYQTRDFAPKLAARLDRAIITDVTAVRP